MTFSFLPILLVDLSGSILMIIFGFMCLVPVHRLKRRNPNNVIWT